MRELTPAESRVIAGLLGSAAASERERLRRIAVPRSTYHAARRRAYAEGWLRDRYVPQPERIGFEAALVIAARPFVERTEELVDRWSRASSCVYLEAGSDLLLGVFVEPHSVDARTRSDQLLAGNLTSWHQEIVADLHRPSIPVYFDYEGLWAHLSGVGGTVAYPRGLGGTSAAEGPPPLTPHQRWAVGELLHRPFAPDADAKEGHLVGPFGLPFSQQRMMANGTISHRVFLNPAQVPPFQGHAADQLVLVTGALKAGARPEVLFRTLTQECRVFPFLFVVDGDRALLGALGRAGLPGGESPEARRPVLPTLQEGLQGIEVTQVPAARARTVVDHRYDRLLPVKVVP
ncbi:MAG: hypothetical protein L3K01_03440 [Thermoplasmata archaeon]|nr:hypothetical protein [Thermoplasmata archaeon]